MKESNFLIILILLVLTNLNAQNKSEFPGEFFKEETHEDYLKNEGLFPFQHYHKSNNKLNYYDNNTLKNNNISLQLDSIYSYIFENELDSLLFNRTIIEHDSEGNMVLLKNCTWHSDSEVWVENWKNEYEYDTDGNRILFIRYSWNSNSEEWIGQFKFEYDHDLDGNRVSETRYNWSSQQSWVGDYKREFEYDINGNMLLSTTYNWDSSNGLWVQSSKREYDYNEDGRMTLYSNFNWDDNVEEWIPDWKYEYEYDTSGNRTLWISFNWDNINSIWVGDAKSEYEYNVDGNRILSTSFLWDIENETWILNLRAEYEYNSEGNLTLITNYSWENDMEEWLLNMKMEYEYDSDGNNIYYAQFYWNNNAEEWIANWKYEYQYNEDGYMTMEKKYVWNNSIEEWVGQFKIKTSFLTEEYRLVYSNYNWDNDNKIWVVSMRGFYYYNEAFVVSVNIEPEGSGSVAGEGTYIKDDEVTVEATANEGYEFANWTVDEDVVSDNAVYVFTMPAENLTLTANFSDHTNITEQDIAGKISIFPNPADNNITVISNNKISKINIFDINGKIVNTITVNEFKTVINISNIQTGIYFLQVQTNNNKIITERLNIMR